MSSNRSNHNRSNLNSGAEYVDLTQLRHKSNEFIINIDSDTEIQVSYQDHKNQVCTVVKKSTFPSNQGHGMKPCSRSNEVTRAELMKRQQLMYSDKKGKETCTCNTTGDYDRHRTASAGARHTKSYADPYSHRNDYGPRPKKHDCVTKQKQTVYKSDSSSTYTTAVHKRPKPIGRHQDSHHNYPDPCKTFKTHPAAKRKQDICTCPSQIKCTCGKEVRRDKPQPQPQPCYDRATYQTQSHKLEAKGSRPKLDKNALDLLKKYPCCLRAAKCPVEPSSTTCVPSRQKKDICKPAASTHRPIKVTESYHTRKQGQRKHADTHKPLKGLFVKDPCKQMPLFIDPCKSKPSQPYPCPPHPCDPCAPIPVMPPIDCAPTHDPCADPCRDICPSSCEMTPRQSICPPNDGDFDEYVEEERVECEEEQVECEEEEPGKGKDEDSCETPSEEGNTEGDDGNKVDEDDGETEKNEPSLEEEKSSMDDDDKPSTSSSKESHESSKAPSEPPSKQLSVSDSGDNESDSPLDKPESKMSIGPGGDDEVWLVFATRSTELKRMISAQIKLAPNETTAEKDTVKVIAATHLYPKQRPLEMAKEDDTKKLFEATGAIKFTKA